VIVFFSFFIIRFVSHYDFVIVIIVVVIVVVVVVVVPAVEFDPQIIVVGRIRVFGRGRRRGIVVTRGLGDEAEDLNKLAAEVWIVHAQIGGSRRGSDGLDEAVLALETYDFGQVG
jgi:hypothetical protein